MPPAKRSSAVIQIFSNDEYFGRKTNIVIPNGWPYCPAFQWMLMLVHLALPPGPSRGGVGSRRPHGMRSISKWGWGSPKAQIPQSTNIPCPPAT